MRFYMYLGGVADIMLTPSFTPYTAHLDLAVRRDQPLDSRSLRVSSAGILLAVGLHTMRYFT